MGWNPQINFKLRDDEITFGDLIFDKGSAELLCKALTAIKNGQSVGNDVIKSIIESGCYTDKELEALRKEFDEVKNDISYFKRLRASGFTSGVANWAKRVDANINYVTGSNTWIEKYKELKLCACEMYESLLGKGYAFTPQERAAFDKRYSDIMKSTTSKERLDGVLRKQYYEDLVAGVPNAADIYIQAQVDNGIITEQQAEGKRRLFGAVSKSVVKTDSTDEFSGDSKTFNSDGVEVGIHVEDTTNDTEVVTVTSKLLMDKLNQIKGISDFKDKAFAGMTLYKYVKSALVEAGVNTDKADLAVKNFIEVQDVSMGELFTVLSATISQVDTSAIGTLFDSISCEVKKSDWDTIVKQEAESVKDKFELNCNQLEVMLRQVQGITDFGKSCRTSIVLLNLIKNVFTEKNASYPADIDVVLNSDMPFGEVVKSTVAVISKVTSTAGYRNIIDNCHKEIDTSWWNRQLQ